MKPIESLLAFLDTETSGLTPGMASVLEVAIILTKLDGEEVARFESKFHPRLGDAVSLEAAAINGYDLDTWQREARPFSDFTAFLKRHIPFGHVAIPVGHNVGFDRDMLDLGYFKPHGIFFPLSYHKVDTVGLACAMRTAGLLKCENLKLGTVATALGFEVPMLHRAMVDCELARKLYHFVVGRLNVTLRTPAP